ncbi:hypothetical protein [Corynebacterium ulcerans]|uniref:hypothetical protein n=1 Tax=Corynebacterium ulcerans TaxID=65058 RepID=UPI0015E08669|nr:hypothetical protein [Corynebacterium ulcerans]
MNTKIIGSLCNLIAAIGCTIIMPIIWPLTTATVVLAIINIRTQLRKRKAMNTIHR